jgi:hypothetical protein
MTAPFLDPAGTDHHVVFVGGLHRSGTTPLARAMAAHPDVSGFEGTTAEEDEGQHLQHVMPTGEAFGGPGRFARDPASAMTEESPLATPAAARMLADLWTPYWDLSKRVLVEKSPPNVVRMRYLQALFPNASFVMILRHPVVVALSTKKWARRNSYRSVFENWFAAHDTMRADAAHIERLHVIKYEDLVSRPDEVLAGVTDFLGLDSPIPADVVQGGRSSSYEQTWSSWQHARNPYIAARYRDLVARFDGRAREYGYRLDDLDAIEPFTLGGTTR